LLKSIITRNFRSVKLYIYASKIIIILGILFAKYLEDSFPMSYIIHRLRNMYGMKIFAFFKFIEIFNNIFNKFNHDIDIQIINCIRAINLRKKLFFSSILLFSLCIHIMSFWSYMIGISFILNDPNDFIYMIFIKLNFLEFKKAAKGLKKKKILNLIMTDIYDRFSIFAGLILVIFENYYQNKINSHNFLYYFTRVFYLIFAEMFFDWLKGIVMYKLSSLDSTYYKNFYFEIVMFHEKLKFNCFNNNGGKGLLKNENYVEYVNKIEKYEFKVLLDDDVKGYSNCVEYDNLAAVKIGSTNITICILIISFILRNTNKIVFSKMILIIIILIIIQRINRLIISNIAIRRIDRYLEKQEKNKIKEKVM